MSPRPIRRHRHLAAAVLAGALVAMLHMGGCASSQPISYSAPRSETPFDEAANRPPTSATLLAMARILAGQNREAEARHVLQHIVQVEPHFAPAHNALAEHHMRSGSLDEAIRVLEQAMPLCPDDPVLVNNLGMCRLLRTDYAAALQHFTHAVNLAPGDTRYRANMAAALGMLGRTSEARTIYEQFLPPEEAARNVHLLMQARTRALTDAPATPPQPQLPRASGYHPGSRLMHIRDSATASRGG